MSEIKRVPYSGMMSELFPFYTTDPLQEIFIENLIYFDYRYFRFIYNVEIGKYVPTYSWIDKCWQKNSVSEILQLKSCLNAQQVKQRVALFGLNEINIEDKSTIRLLFDEILHPFFVFQIASIILWSIDDYYYYAGCIFIITTISSVDTLITTKANIQKLKQVILQEKAQDVLLFREGKWSAYAPKDVVPGDIFQIKQDESGRIPNLFCDAVIFDNIRFY
jgi:cation-transporting ATPase 13A2